MKRYFYPIVLSCLFVLAGCSTNSTVDVPTQSFEIIRWNLIKTTGGIAGVNYEFSLKTVVWTFDINKQQVNVVNSNTDTTKQDALATGTYPYEEIESKGNKFLNIDGNTFGKFTFTSNDQLIIDQNERPEGTGADGFVFTFQKVVEIVN